MAYEYKTATIDNSKPFGAWLNSVAVDGWRLKLAKSSNEFIFEREKTIVKTAPIAPKKKKISKPD